MQSTGQNGVSDSPHFLAASAPTPNIFFSMPHDYISLSPPTGYHSHSQQGHHALAHHLPHHLQAQQHQQQHYYARHSEDMAAAALPTLDQMTGARAGLEYHSDHHPMATSEAVNTVSEAPAVYRQHHQEEGDFLQTGRSSNPWWDQVRGNGDTSKVHSEPGVLTHMLIHMLEVDTVSEAPAVYRQEEGGFLQTDRSSNPWWDQVRGNGDTSKVHSEPGGAVHEGYEPEKRILGVELDFGISEDIANRHEYQEDSGDIFVGNDGQLELLTFPEGEDDAVTITTNDLEGLQPARFLSNNVIDFYIKYLERRLSAEQKSLFYFFNSFFFTKLLGDSNATTDIDECEVDYKQVQRWAGEVNLFEKDYVFIPILRREHWSLIIICHLSGLTSSPDKRKGSPCVYHLDPIEGRHESFKDQVRSYILQAWMERCRDLNDRDQKILALACKMKYVQAKVPQQDNGYDCGLYLLHYVELFLHESTSPDFSFPSSKAGLHLSSPHFAQEISAKRAVIENLIIELRNNLPERASRRMHIQPKPQPRASDVQHPNAQSKPLQNKIGKKWNEEETSILLNRLVEGGRIRKGAKGPTHWDLISKDIHTNCETVRSEDECRRRYDTLLKAYKRIKKTGKPFCDITDAERREVNLATPLTEEWYKAIDRICLQRSSDNPKSRKRAKLNSSGGNGASSSSPRNLVPPRIPSGCPEREKPSRNRVAIPGFNGLDEDLRSTFLNLIQEFMIKNRRARKYKWDSNYQFPIELEVACQRLAIVQNREPSAIRKFMFLLSERKFVNVGYKWWDDEELPCLTLTNLWWYEKFVEKFLRCNPRFDIYLRIENIASVSFPNTAPLSSSLQQIKVLCLFNCQKLEHIDLTYFPELLSLTIKECYVLKSVTGWEVVKELGWLEIRECRSYQDSPRVQCLPSLRELHFMVNGWSALQMISVPDLGQCVRLRRLEIGDYEGEIRALNSVDLSNLRYLEVLRLFDCSALTTIQGLSGLQSLTRLDLSGCRALRRVPELGCLKALTHLDMWGSGVEEIPGVQELHLLTRLVLFNCISLKTLPWLGHLKALAYLDIKGSGVEEIPGVEDLVSLESLDCAASILKRLPDLHHLPRLQEVEVGRTPLTTTDPSSLWQKFLRV